MQMQKRMGWGALTSALLLLLWSPAGLAEPAEGAGATTVANIKQIAIIGKKPACSEPLRRPTMFSSLDKARHTMALARRMRTLCYIINRGVDTETGTY